MPWGPRKDSEICAIHAAVVPTANGDGEVIYFGGDEHSPPELLANHLDKSRRMNCRNEAVTYVASPPADLFCCGHSILADGRVLVGGGTETFESESPGEHGMLGHFTAEKRCWVYNPFAPGFSPIASFGPEPGFEDIEPGGGRWYPTIITLPSGQVLAFGGHPHGSDTRHENNTPERYLPILNSWRRLAPFDGANGYDRAYVVPNGQVLLVAAGSNSVFYNPWTDERTTITSAPPGDYGGYTYSSVMLPLVPGSYAARVLVAGDTTASVLDLSVASPSWQPTGPRIGSAAGKQRKNCVAVLLPTGKVLVVGGAQDSGNDATAVLEPELYDPASNTWQTIEEPAQQARNYHSTALLLPDGRVWTAGSNVNSGRTEGGVERRVRNFEIFTPPYPAGTRPTISTCPTRIGYGAQFTVTSPQAASISRIALLRCGSSTHAWNGDQRYVEAATLSRDGDRLTATAPPNGGIAPPGYYMLFLIDESGRPCDYARFVRLGGDMAVVTDRSHFSQVEVEAQGVPTIASPTWFYDAFYVIFDGYLASDLGLPGGPGVTITRVDSGATVPGLFARLESTSFEAGSPAPGVAQKIVLSYSLRFENSSAFSGIPDSGQRELRVRVRAGDHEAQATLTLFRRKNPFMIDGDPHWLSTDVRVLQIREDERFAGQTQTATATAPQDFLSAALTELRARPEGATHPFDVQLKTVQAESKLELAGEVGGKKVYNYAFARVRYRAPTGQHALGVKVLFRMFTTAAASLEFRPSVYPMTETGAGARPLLGLAGGEVASIPFFAAARASNLELQDDPQNQRQLNGEGTEYIEYFGAWLDINQDVGRFRERPTSNGTGGTGSLLSIQEHIRGQHQCLVAQVHFIDDPIPGGATPGDNDNLAQRNLMIVDSDNPGGGAGHRVQHTFELEPSSVWPKETKFGIAKETTHLVSDAAIGAIRGGLALGAQQGDKARWQSWDQLMIRWGDVPRASTATLYFPDVDMDQVLEVAALTPGAGMLERVDAHTVRCRIGDVTLLPIPGNRSTNIPGLVSIQLPDDIRAGQEFRVTFHQISGTTRKVKGTFQVTIPVGLGPQLLEREERKLAVLRHIATKIPDANRWSPIFVRYLKEIEDRVRVFGGDPTQVLPSPAGIPPKPIPQDPTGGFGEKGEDATATGTGHVWTGKVVQVVYGCFGDFEGFVLQTCRMMRRFETREPNVERIVLRACHERAQISVIEDPPKSRHAMRIVWHGP